MKYGEIKRLRELDRVRWTGNKPISGTVDRVTSTLVGVRWDDHETTLNSVHDKEFWSYIEKLSR